MKKWLVFILAMVVMAGFVFPCCVEVDCQDKQTTSCADHEQPGDKGNCSPFFACGTCAGFVHTTKQLNLCQPLVQQVEHFEEYSVFFTSTYYSSFFQPPRSIPQIA